MDAVSGSDGIERSAYRQPGWDRRRVASVALTLLAHLLVVLLLIELAPRVDQPPRAREATSFTFLPDAGQETPSRQRRTERRQVRAAARPAARAAPKSPPVTIKAPAEAAAEWPKEIMQLGLAANDIGKIKGSAAPAEGTGDATGDSASATGPGAGPGGQRLYEAEWFREPRQSELDFYLPKNLPLGAWATIACRTADRYHVEDCRILEEAPAGTGLARGVRSAAWQFLVRPPRIGGRAIPGAWVRIRITIDKLAK